MDGTKNNAVVDYSYHLAEIEKKDKEIAELDERNLSLNKAMVNLRFELSRLTAALKDDERAEKVARKDAISSSWIHDGYYIVRRQAISDYRTEILKEAGV